MAEGLASSCPLCRTDAASSQGLEVLYEHDTGGSKDDGMDGKEREAKRAVLAELVRTIDEVSKKSNYSIVRLFL